MAEFKVIPEQFVPDIGIKKCAAGFLVIGGSYGDTGLRAFSTAEGLIEWLSRELGGGPIVWGLTLEVWALQLDVKTEDLLPVPDFSVDQAGYHQAIEGNATFLMHQFLERELKAMATKLPPEPKPKKEKKGKEERHVTEGPSTGDKASEPA